MVKITVRGEANAQALFDVLNGRGVTWAHPFTPRGSHVLTVRDWVGTAYSLGAFLRKCFPEMRFSAKEF